MGQRTHAKRWRGEMCVRAGVEQGSLLEARVLAKISTQPAETRRTRRDAGRADFHQSSGGGHATGGLDVAPGPLPITLSRYLISGCAGFLGSHLTEALLEQGNDVVGVDGFTDFYSRDATSPGSGATEARTASHS
jgi:hypothetical protein